MTESKFVTGQRLRHHKGGEYIISVAPDHRRLEYCNERFYEYIALQDGTVWVRRQSEMEDGRFEVAD